MWGRLMIALAALGLARVAHAAPTPATAPPDTADAAPDAPDDAPPGPPPDAPPPPPDGRGLPSAGSAAEWQRGGIDDFEPPALGPDDGPSYGDPEPAPTPAPHADEFGPVLQIEAIEIAGNTATQTEVIRRALRLNVGDVLRASDKRLRDARFKVLALGFFRDVALAMRKGTQRGHVVVDVRVVERGTLVLNRLWFGTTAVSPWWFGADLGERNLFGLGISVGGGFIYAHQADVASGRDQYAGELRVAQSSLLGTPWGVSGAATLVHGSEPFRVAGAASDTSPSTFQAFPYRRIGVRFGATYNLSALTQLSMGVRAESIHADVPTAPTRALEGGAILPVDLHLVPGASRVITASFGIDRDTRPDPILPHAGSHLQLSAELGNAIIGSDYDYATLFGRYEHYWPLFHEHHAIAIKLGGGVVIGDAPRFDRIHVADVDRMLTPRALGLVLSTSAPLSILGTRADKPTYGDLGGTVTVEYALQLFRGKGKRRVYGGDVFFGAGLWGLADRDELRVRDTTLIDALPIDIYVDAGLRLDTDLGTFELTIANALGRLR